MPPKKKPVVRLPLEVDSQNSQEEDETTQNSNATYSSSKRRSGEGRKNLHYEMLQELSPILEAAQERSSNMEKLVEKTKRIFDKSDRKVFAAVLWRMMIVPFDVKEKYDTVERIVAFFHAFLCQVVKNEVAASPTGENTLNETSAGSDLISHQMLRLCEKFHEDYRPHVRMRIVQTIVKICDSCQSMDDIDKKLKNKIKNVLLTRLKDKQSSVRCEAAKGLCYFQGGQGCPVTSKMMEFIRMDPRPEVRRALVLSIVLDSDDYGDFLDRVTDVHPEVRRACIRQTREIALESIPLDQREKIVNCGLSDTSTAVRAETTKLIRHWFKVCDEDPIKFLNTFEVYYCSNLCIKMLNILFPDATDSDWEKLDSNLREDKFVPLNQISELKCFLWWYLFQRFSSQTYYAEKLFPTIAEMSSYCKQLIDKLETECFDDEERSKIMGLFLKIVLFIPVEEGGRHVLDKMVRGIFKFEHKTTNQMKPLVQMLHKAHPNGCDEILLEIIRDTLECSNSHIQTMEHMPQLNRDEEIRQLKLKLSTIVHKRYKVQKEKDELVKVNDFLKAHAIQEELKVVEEELAAARLDLQNLENAVNVQVIDAEEPLQERPEYPADALVLAFAAFSIHLRLAPKISVYVKNFYHADVVGAIFREEPDLRIQVLRIVTQMGCFSLEDAIVSMVMCLQAVLNETGNVQHVALQGIFDLLLKHGLDSFEDEKVKAVFTENIDLEDETETESVEKLIGHLLTSYFKAGDDETTLHIAIVGVLKLLIMGRLHAPRIVATLLAFWANSANEGTRVCHDIGTGLSIYVQQSSEKAETVARALVPSVLKVINAPLTSSLKQVDPEKLMGYITMQTDQSKLISVSNSHMPHQIIAQDILEEIRKRPISPEVAVFVKALKGLNLRGISPDTLLQLKSLLKFGIKECLKTIRLSLTAFGKYLDELDPEVRALEQVSEPDSNSSSNEESEDNDKTDMFVTTLSKTKLSSADNDRTVTSVRNDTLKSNTHIDEMEQDSSDDESTLVEDNNRTRTSKSDFKSQSLRKK